MATIWLELSVSIIITSSKYHVFSRLLFSLVSVTYGKEVDP